MKCALPIGIFCACQCQDDVPEGLDSAEIGTQRCQLATLADLTQAFGLFREIIKSTTTRIRETKLMPASGAAI